MTSRETGAAGARPSARRRLTVRTTILIAMVALTGGALILAGLVASSLQDLRLEARIDADLDASAQEFRVLAEVGVDPETGEPFSSPADLVRTAMERIIPARHEGVLGFVGGDMAYTSRGADLSLEDDEGLLAQLEPLVTGERAVVETIETPTTTYRVAVVPVRTAADGTLAEEADDASPAFDSVASLVLAYDLTAETRTFREVFLIYAAVALVALALVGVVGWVVAGRLLRPVRVLAAGARRIGREDLSERVPVEGSDDMADMTQSVNEMLARLEASFASHEALIGDVSHELRTPLTVIRGHLELMDTSDPADAAEVRALVLDEVARMNRVVGDLSLLASVDRPDFVSRGPVDVGLLTDAVLERASTLGDRRWHVEERASDTIEADRERLTQAWLQLLANAVKFSEDGSTIALGSAVDADQARLWVTDHGVGIDPADQDRIFERFERAAGTPAPGSGLGLPIVRAIARAHGGDATVASRPGSGATFTIAIPIPPEDLPDDEEQA